MPLLNRQMMVPGGFRFVQPELNWKSTPWASFEVIVREVIAVRSAHPALCQKFGWALDYGKVADEVDNFNSAYCAAMGYTKYISAGSGGQPVPAPFLPAPSPVDQGKLAAAASAVKAIWSGVRTLNDWLDSGGEPVPAAQSASRAAVCAVCPKNSQGDFSQWFTKPASEAIRKQLERVKDRNLSTPDDSKINICGACWCPLRLMVHTPIEYKLAHLSDEARAGLDVNCWIPREEKELKSKSA